MTVQACAVIPSGHSAALAVISKDARSIASAQVVAALTGRGTDNILRTVVNCLALISWITERTQRRGVRTATDCFVVGATVWRRKSHRRPGFAIIIRVSVDSVRAGRRVRCESPARLLVRPKDRIKTYVCYTGR